MAAIDQIKDGKHLYRCLEAYFAMYLALYRYRCCILAFLDSNQETEKELRGDVLNAIIEVSEYNSSKTDFITDSRRSLLEAIKSTVLLSCRKNFILSYPTSEDFSEIL